MARITGSGTGETRSFLDVVHEDKKVPHLKRPKPDDWNWEFGEEDLKDLPTDRQIEPLHRLSLFKRLDLSLKERKRIVAQATFLLEEVYAHREHKRTVYGVDPVLRLKALARRLAEPAEEEPKHTSLAEAPVTRDQLAGLGFHREMTSIFNSVRDLHTVYLRPQPLRDLVALLPFDVERAYEEKQDPEGRTVFESRYVVTHVRHQILDARAELAARPPAAPLVEIGWEVELWNGRPIELAIARNAAEHAGSNEAARFAIGLEQLTMRPLATSPLPDEVWVRVLFKPPGEEPVFRDFRWLVTGVSKVRSRGEDKSGLHVGGERAARYRYSAWEERDWLESTHGDHSGARRDYLHVSPSFERHLFACRVVCSQDGREVCYLRILSFHNLGPQAFRREVKRLLTDPKTPQNGLILDLRGNPGGEIQAAEAILQLFTPRTIEPERFQFVHSSLTRRLTDKADGRGPRSRHPDLSPWSAAADPAATARTSYSRAHPITTSTTANKVGQVYYGPCVLIVDAQTYSAADMFSAGFQDHEIGPVVGTALNTGAGGANQWSYAFLSQVMAGIDAIPDLQLLAENFPRLPGAADLQVAIRRSLRVGRNTGVPLEDLGVVPDYLYLLSKDDLVKENQELLQHAAELIRPVDVGAWNKAEQKILDRHSRLRKLGDRCRWPEPAVRSLKLTPWAGLGLKLPGVKQGKIKTKSSEVTCQAITVGIERLDVYVGGRPERHYKIGERIGFAIGAEMETPIRISLPKGNPELKLEGYARNKTGRWELVASSRRRKTALRQELIEERRQRRREERRELRKLKKRRELRQKRAARKRRRGKRHQQA